MNERKTFVFVPSRSHRGCRTEGHSDVDPGEFLLCLLLNACVALFAKHEISRSMRTKHQIFPPPPFNNLNNCPPLFLCFSFFFRMANYISRHMFPFPINVCESI